MARDYREEVGRVVKDYVNQSLSESPKHFSADKVSSDIFRHFKWPAGTGLEQRPVLQVRSVEPENALEWAAKRYFEILASDWKGFRGFRDHTKCDKADRHP
jgi:hypothetical protein